MDETKNKKAKKVGWRKLAELFITFFKIGLFTIGGGLAMIPIIRKEFVEKQKWVDDEKIVDIFAISQSLPGAIAINSTMYLGYEMAGLAGLIVSAAGVILPSFLTILIIAFFLSSIGDNLYVSSFFLGVRSAVVPLILLSAINISKSAIKDKFGVIVAVFSIVATIFVRLDILFIVLTGGVAGYIFYTYKWRVKKQ